MIYLCFIVNYCIKDTPTTLPNRRRTLLTMLVLETTLSTCMWIRQLKAQSKGTCNNNVVNQMALACVANKPWIDDNQTWSLNKLYLSRWWSPLELRVEYYRYSHWPWPDYVVRLFLLGHGQIGITLHSLQNGYGNNTNLLWRFGNAFLESTSTLKG